MVSLRRVDHEVLGPVVGSVAVDVVNALTSSQRPSEHLRGDDAVFHASAGAHVAHLRSDPNPTMTPDELRAIWHQRDYLYSRRPSLVSEAEANAIRTWRMIEARRVAAPSVLIEAQRWVPVMAGQR